MTYDEVMKTFTLNKPYAIKGPELETKKNKLGKTYKFNPEFVVVVDRTRVRVLGRQEHIWCSLDYKMRTLPKWLQRSMEKAQR